MGYAETDEGRLNGTEIGKMLISEMLVRLRYEHYSFINLNFSAWLPH